MTWLDYITAIPRAMANPTVSGFRQCFKTSSPIDWAVFTFGVYGCFDYLRDVKIITPSDQVSKVADWVGTLSCGFLSLTYLCPTLTRYSIMRQKVDLVAGLTVALSGLALAVLHAPTVSETSYKTAKLVAVRGFVASAVFIVIRRAYTMSAHKLGI
jgi:hypothetical protein